MTDSVLPELSPLQARVLGVLVEKKHTVPDTYPLTLNALTAGCNQKSSRDPVMSVSESEVQSAIDDLRHLSLVFESSGGRVMRYEHNVDRVLKIPSQSVALLTVLMLRGPQTVGELRINSDRLHKFLDLSSVEAFLAELAEREAGALVRELARQPGARETRWMHTLCGVPAWAQAPAHGSLQERDARADEGRPRGPGAASAGPSGVMAPQDWHEMVDAQAERIDALLARIEALEQRVEGLASRVDAGPAD